MPRLAAIPIAAVILFSLFKSGVMHALLMFVMVGAVPSTTYTFSPFVMLTMIIIVGWLVVIQAVIVLIKTQQRRSRQYLDNYRHSPAIRRTRPVA